MSNRKGTIRFCVAAGTALLASSLYAGAAEVVRYRLDENTGTKANDSALPANHNGTINGAFTWQTDAVRGVSLDFDPDTTNIDILDNPDSTTANSGNLVSNSPGITLMAWVKPDAFVPDGDQYDAVVFISDGDGADRVRAGLYIGGNTQQSGFLRVGGRSSAEAGDPAFFAQSTQTIQASPTGNAPWVHVAGVLDFAGKRISLYINGNPAGSFATDFGASASGSAPSLSALVGMRSDGNHRFDGNIDDVRIFNEALTAQQIQAIVPEPASIGAIAVLGGTLLSRRRRK